MPTLALPLAADHPAFVGHFPGRPIVPGVVLLDLAIVHIEAAESARVSAVAMAKFLSPVVPGEALWIDYTRQDASVRVDIRTADRTVANARLSVT